MKPKVVVIKLSLAQHMLAYNIVFYFFINKLKHHETINDRNSFVSSYGGRLRN